MIELMKELCALPGPSGCEDAVRAFVLKRVKPFADEIRTDAIGNVMVFRKGRKALDRPVAVCAHMDEVGVIIKKITEDGMLKFGFVGGVDPRVVIGRPVRRPIIRETTALGAAYLAGLAVGVWKSLDDIKGQWTLDKVFTPSMEPSVRERNLSGWSKAIGRSRGWAE